MFFPRAFASDRTLRAYAGVAGRGHGVGAFVPRWTAKISLRLGGAAHAACAPRAWTRVYGGARTMSVGHGSLVFVLASVELSVRSPLGRAQW